MPNDGKQIGEIGNNFSQFKKIQFNSNQSLLDFDLIFVDLNFITTTLAPSYRIGSTLFKISLAKSNDYLLEKRRKELDEFYKTGRAIVLFLPVVETYNLYSDSGGFLKSLFNIDILPRKLFLDDYEGEQIEICHQTEFTKLLTKYSHIFRYKSALKTESEFGSPIAKIKNTEKVIGTHDDNFYLIPSLKNTAYLKKAEIDNFGHEIVDLIFPEKIDYVLPEWAGQSLLIGEEAVNEEKNNLVNQKEQIEIKISQLDVELDEFIKYKILLAASGNTLEEAVLNIFKKLGVGILDVDLKRDDLIFEHEGKVAVVEIKGVSKSAAESHAAQLEKWVSGYMSDNNVSAKGILIVNPYKETELPKRPDISFPPQMKKYSVQREHCLLTTTQLLGLYFDCLSRPNEKNAIINKLFDTIGEMEDYKDWTNFIKFS